MRFVHTSKQYSFCYSLYLVLLISFNESNQRPSDAPNSGIVWIASFPVSPMNELL